MKIQSKYLYYAGGAVIGLSLILLLHKYSKSKSKPIDLSLFDSPDQKGSGNQMKPSFLNLLQKAEKMAGFKFNYNSAYRTRAYNIKVGGVSNSAHLYGLAVDIKAASKAIRDKIVWAAKKAGFKRIGIGSNFVHLDSDSSKPQYAAWGYPLGAKPPFNPFA